MYEVADLVMDHLRQIEEDLRTVHVEAKKRYPEVAEAAEQALDSLKAVREVYVNDLRRSSSKDVKLMQASDISSPYILLCNYADCNSKLVGTALSSLLFLANHDIIPVVEIPNILRVLLIQASAGKVELQAKIVQLVLQLTSMLTKDKASLCLVTEQAIATIISILLTLTNDVKGSSSISAAASGTLKQVVALFCERTASIWREDPNDHDTTICYTLGLISIFQELCTSIHSQILKQPNTSRLVLDVIDDIFRTWAEFLRECPHVMNAMQKLLIPSAIMLCKNLRTNFILHYSKYGPTIASALCYKSVRLVCICLSQFAVGDDHRLLIHILDENLHSFQDFSLKDIENKWSMNSKTRHETDSIRSKIEEASTLLLSGGASSLLSKFSLLPTHGAAVSKSSTSLSHDKAAFMIIPQSHSRSDLTGDNITEAVMIVVQPAVYCLDALLCHVFKYPYETGSLNSELMSSLIECCGSCSRVILSAATSEADYK